MFVVSHWRSPPASAWEEFWAEAERDTEVISLHSCLLDPISTEEVLIGFRIQSYLTLGSFATLSFCCRQRGWFTELLRNELEHREALVFGIDLARHRRRLRAQRLGFQRSIWLVDQELRTHRPLSQ